VRPCGPDCFAAQKVARASQLQIQGRNAKAGAQLRELSDGRPNVVAQSARDSCSGRNQQICVSPAVRAAYAAAQLIKLRKTVRIGAIYDDCVRARDVYSILDNRGRNEHVIFVINEIQHDALHLFLIHLAVTHGDARLGHKSLHQRGDRLDRLDPIVE
jgi:hypothetical protein